MVDPVEALRAAIAEAARRYLVPDRLVVSVGRGRRISRELLQPREPPVEATIDGLLGVQLTTSNLLCDRYGILESYPYPRSALAMLVPQVIGAVDFGED